VDESIDLGYFGPDSVSWKVFTEVGSGVGGLRSLLLQALHPLAMAGVNDHSTFARDFWGRMARTGEYVQTLVFGTREAADAIAARVRAIHPHIHGVDRVTGRAYRADDPDLLRWVHVAEMESFVDCVQRSGAGLSPADVDRFYAEQQVAGRLIGVPDVPTSSAEVADYYARVLPELVASPLAEESSARLMLVPLPGASRLFQPAWSAVVSLAVLTLPPWARRLYGLPTNGLVDLAAVAGLRALRTAAKPLPLSVRLGPIAQNALARAESLATAA
jgi:uncharacterized protein (DUF2236 family)